ncbi:nuclear transport factor 2 family protein [Sporosarcina highlanderae]|uniref:Nuclear transport factor 2 family protein n=1 Tax=Sporosarcina highlanderae TaxID=3035916 RepID=A0ABT8JRA2_9BACL|nr:nuclear transport factor 2 family protein [Sporosarcina highlanderae]MDN4607686.1 nuclear transport factor 2 family protein [Sporosarcina highlanderae]
MEKIQEVLDEYFKAWNAGFISKNGDGIRQLMSENFVGYWAHSTIIQPDPYYYDYDLNGVLKEMDHAEKSLRILSIAERNDGNEVVVIGRETNVIGGEPYHAQCMFVWRKEEQQWKLLREYIELER